MCPGILTFWLAIMCISCLPSSISFIVSCLHICYLNIGRFRGFGGSEPLKNITTCTNLNSRCSCEEQHCAFFKTLCLHPDYVSSHIDKIFVNKHAHRIFSSSMYYVCVMTSTDNIIDAVVMCVCVNKSTPLNKMSRSAPAKAAKYSISVYLLG